MKAAEAPETSLQAQHSRFKYRVHPCSIKSALGILPLPEPPATYVPKRLAAQGIRPLPVTHSYALAVAGLPLHHRDPFDRILVVQAQMEEMTVLTADRAFDKYRVEVLWCGRSKAKRG
ncbi:MAG TPA: type II toxin-antitoxin system VapC family toxin [Terriglobia bacterium]|nr:type II toxin-antitoxin system VapC family toxin [Terriglobia bacterium]